MKMKKLIPMMLFASVSIAAMGQAPLKSGIDLKNLNQSVKPAEDFYEFACGGWMKNNPLPGEYSRFGSFDQLAKNNTERINSILGELLKNSYTKGTTEQKLSDLYKLAMDSVRRNNEGVKPVMPIIKNFEKAKTNKDLLAMQLKYAKMGMQEFMYMGFGADQKNAKNNILTVYQGGIQLGEREYYLDNDPATKAIREAYKKHIVRMFKIFGFNEKEATKKMNAIMKVETSLAKVSKSQTELRDVEANYNKMTAKDFEAKYPNIPLVKQMQALDINSKDYQDLVVGQPSFVDGANKVIATIKPEEYRAILEWDVILSYSNYLSDEVVDANFDFFGKTFSGKKENTPRWKRATNQVEGQMGEALGKIYVEKYFPASSKERMEKLVKNLQISLGQRIQAQDWMSEATKKAGLDKLNAFYVKIGYPNKWTDMTKLVIDPSKSYCENIMACQEFHMMDELSRTVGKPVDKDRWQMNPQTVNAYYDPTTNEICFPAGILQYPFFDPNADDAFNYGAIGVVIGHEMTHGFDDQGRHYDKTGNMTDWWTAQDGQQFIERTKKYAEFFSKIKVLPDLNANGDLTLGENLADHGGLQVAFNAYKNATKDNPLKDIDGFTPDQRFFLAYAGVWASNITEKAIRNQTKSDPHSLGRWRVDGALPHIDAWYNAFNVQPNEKMFIPKEQRLSLW
ncbi:MAG: M13 family metallopeptidase [Bacteroidales bacterium]|jgi:putative endopeptidase|nr:M13 family metallopeptidase [Bacteroidales bacterium]